LSQPPWSSHVSPEEVVKLFRRAVDVWRDMERVFHIEAPNKFQLLLNGTKMGEDDIAQREREYWYRLVLAANFRKFAHHTDGVYLPRVLEALITLGWAPASHDDVEFLRLEFKSVHEGRRQIGSYENGRGKSFSSFQIVDHLLHSLFLHSNSSRLAEIDELPQDFKSSALWEWLAFYRPLLDLLASTVEKIPEAPEN
jgi:hypothetical protein